MSGALYVSDGELVSELGDLCAAALLGAFGGQRIYVPRAPHPDHPLSQAIGAKNAAKVAAMFSTGRGGLWIELPSGRTSRANAARRCLMELAASRLSEGQIARELNVHIRTVRRARARLKAEAA